MSSLKTIEYVFPELETFTDNTDTNFTQITVYIPETVSAFRSVVLDVMFQDANAGTAANVTQRQLSLQLAAAGYTTVNNTSTLTQSGEQQWLSHSADFTSHFTTNWTGTSMTCDARILVNSAAASPVLRSATAILRITYEYDETDTTQIKTVRIPLDAPLANLATSKPGSATATIPALDTWLPESSKAIRQTAIVIQGNDNTTATTDITISMELDSAGARTTQAHEKAQNTAVWFRHTWHESFTTNATHDFFIWASLASCPSLQVWLVVTYEYDDSATTSVMQSLLLPMEFDSPMGNSAADFQRASRSLWIAEPGTIAIQQSALFLFWDQAAAIASLNARVGTGSFNAITNAAATVAGGMGAMLRAESIVTLDRGKNTLQADIYRTDTSDLGMNVCSVWMLNYTSSKSTKGTYAHNHTVCWNVFTQGTASASLEHASGTITPVIPETSYFMSAIGSNYQYLSNTTGNPAGVVVQVERLSAEGGQAWDSVYADVGHTDPEVGVRQCWATARSVFQRWPGDTHEGTRLDFETGRRWKVALAAGCTAFDNLDLWFTYHSITFTVSGDVSDSDAGTVDIKLYRDDGDERVLETTRSGDGAYSFTWYDNTAEMYVVCSDASGNGGRSANGTATGSP